MSKWTYMNIKGQGHSLTLVQGHSDSTFSNFFFLETAKPTEAKFQVKPSCDRGTKMVSVIWPIWLPCSYMVKTLKKSSSLESKRWPWKFICSIGYSSTTSLFKWWPWVDLDLFYGKVKFRLLCFCMEKKLKQWIFQKLLLVVYDIKVGRWYTALSTRVLPGMFKWSPLVDLDLFYGKVKLCSLRFCMGKS